MARFSNVFGKLINTHSLFFVGLCGMIFHLSYAVYVCEMVGNFECRITPNGSTSANGTITNTLRCLFARNLEPDDPKQYICNFPMRDTGCQVGCPQERCLNVTIPNNSTNLIRVINNCGQVYLQYQFNMTNPGTTITTVSPTQCSSLDYNVLVPQ